MSQKYSCVLRKSVLPVLSETSPSSNEEWKTADEGGKATTEEVVRPNEGGKAPVTRRRQSRRLSKMEVDEDVIVEKVQPQECQLTDF